MNAAEVESRAAALPGALRIISSARDSFAATGASLRERGTELRDTGAGLLALADSLTNYLETVVDALEVDS